MNSESRVKAALDGVARIVGNRLGDGSREAREKHVLDIVESVLRDADSVDPLRSGDAKEVLRELAKLGMYVTKTGRVMSDEEIWELAREAEIGYDPARFTRRGSSDEASPRRPGEEIAKLREALGVVLDALQHSDESVRLDPIWMSVESVVDHALDTSDRPAPASPDEF